MSASDTLASWTSPAALSAWWASPSQSSFARDYTPETVLALRDVFPECAGPNAQARKLRAIFASHAAARTPNIAMSAIEPVSLQMMAEVGFETAYVSGGMTSMTDTPTADPSTDLADYTYDTVPRKVAQLYRSQLLHARVAKAHGVPGADAALMPLIADADSGHGLPSSVMKLTKLFVQAGVAGFHIDDLLSGAKRFDNADGVGYVLVPLSEHVRRLKAAKLQLDIMGSEAVSIHRTDAESATHITSSVDPRDRPFILGATVALARDLASLASQTAAARAEWCAAAALMTLDAAFAAACPAETAAFQAQSAGLNTSEALRVARALCPGFYWSAEAPRTPQGWYVFRGGVDAAIARALVCAPHTDVSWSCTMGYDPDAAARFAAAVQAAHPGRWMAANITGGFPEDGSKDDVVRALPQLLADLGFIWQFLPVSGMTAVGLGAKAAAAAVRAGGVFGYVDQVSRAAARQAERDGSSVEWWWKRMGRLTDAAASAIGTGL